MSITPGPGPSDGDGECIVLDCGISVPRQNHNATKRPPPADGKDKVNVDLRAVRECLSNQLDEYLNDGNTGEVNDLSCTLSDIQPLEYMKLKARRFPEIARIANECLSMPASSAQAERVFKTGSHNLPTKRRCLSNTNLENSMKIGTSEAGFWLFRTTASLGRGGLRLDKTRDPMRDADAAQRAECLKYRKSTLFSDLKVIKDVLPFRLMSLKDDKALDRAIDREISASHVIMTSEELLAAIDEGAMDEVEVVQDENGELVEPARTASRDVELGHDNDDNNGADSLHRDGGVTLSDLEESS